tara:strand:+ start:4028 stop:4438 length:411 start_codon:yes stop_codon:yes gene_type:complete
MAITTISDTFDIVMTGSGGLNAAGDLTGVNTFVAPRAFTIVGVSCNNIAAGATTLNVLNGLLECCGTTAAPPVAGSAVVQTQANGFGATQTCTIVGGANCNVAQGAVVTVTAGAVDVTRVILHCVANGLGQTIPTA